MKRMLESFPWETLVPDQSLLKNDNPEDAGYQVAAVSKSKDLLIAYTPYGRKFKIDLTQFAAKSLTAFWFNPRDATRIKIGNVNNEGTTEFVPYTAGPETDWVLVIADSAKSWGK
jgi:hypothetical protein